MPRRSPPVESAVPPLAERQRPGLSDTLPAAFRDPRRCQACGHTHSAAAPLARWLEHDAFDRVPAVPVVVVLCADCGARLIDPHPRLYRQLQPGDAFPGCMRICLPCIHRRQTACTSPLLARHGGDGLRFTWKTPPIIAHLCRSPRALTGFMHIYDGPVLTCTARETEASTARSTE